MRLHRNVNEIPCSFLSLHSALAGYDSGSSLILRDAVRSDVRDASGLPPFVVGRVDYVQNVAVFEGKTCEKRIWKYEFYIVTAEEFFSLRIKYCLLAIVMNRVISVRITNRIPLLGSPLSLEGS